jgi:aconitate hydratase
MINGIGVVGWGVGGIEAEAGMLGQPVYFLTPDVVGFELTRQAARGRHRHRPGAHRHRDPAPEKVVGKFVEFFGEGTRTLSLPDRATIANMAPEYGATMGFFPVDERPSSTSAAPAARRPRSTPSRPTSRRRACSACRRPATSTTRSVLGSTWDRRARLAGPKRPQDRIEIGHVKRPSPSCSASRPGRQRLQPAADKLGHRARPHAGRWLDPQRRRADRRDHQSCTNTSNPGVLLAAGLLAKKAVEAGLTRAPHIKTSLAPGSRIVTEYLRRPACCPTWRSSASTSPPTAAPPASATPAT